MDVLGNSKQPRAEAFQDWLWEICLPALRRQMVLEAQRSGLKNETELHHRVVAFIRKYHKDANISSFGG